MTNITKTKLTLMFTTLVIFLGCLGLLYGAWLIAGNWGGLLAIPMCWVIVAACQVMLEDWGKDLSEE